MDTWTNTFYFEVWWGLFTLLVQEPWPNILLQVSRTCLPHIIVSKQTNFQGHGKNTETSFLSRPVLTTSNSLSHAPFSHFQLKGLQAQAGAPHHRHSSGVSASRHGAGRNRSCHPGRSRWDPPIAPHTCCRQSNEGASIFHDPPWQQKPQCLLRLSDHHTAAEYRGAEE